MKNIMVPFRADPLFQDAIVSGVKTETRRSKSWVNSFGGIRAGDVVRTDFGLELVIVDVYPERL